MDWSARNTFLLGKLIMSKATEMSNTDKSLTCGSSLEKETLKLRNIVESFPHSKFEPSLLWRFPNVQTIIGTGALKAKYFGPLVRTFEVETCERFETPDGDFFDVEFTKGFSDPRDDKSVIIMHGLESNSKGNLVTSFATAFVKKGFSCCLFNFRSCSGEENRTPGAYHIGFTTDLHQLVTALKARHPHKRFYLSGFSLGGNVSLKFLGEIGSEAESRGIYGAAVTCVPFDLTQSQKKLDVGFNRAVYSMNFLETLKAKAELEHKQFPNAFDIDAIRACTTIGAFDEAYIARIYHFKDKYDYYESSGAKNFLHKIRVPAIAINARDDPFVEEASLPTAAHVGEIAPVRLIYHAYGGHCGFYTTQRNMGYEGCDSGVPEHGWLGEELARAIEHIHNQSVSM